MIILLLLHNLSPRIMIKKAGARHHAPAFKITSTVWQQEKRNGHYQQIKRRAFRTALAG